jgi:hypothetical protein
MYFPALPANLLLQSIQSLALSAPLTLINRAYWLLNLIFLPKNPKNRCEPSSRWFPGSRHCVIVCRQRA